MVKGKVPSLLSANNGGIVYDTAKIGGTCNRCKAGITRGIKVGLLKIQKAGFTNKRRLCLACVAAITNKTQEELDVIKAGLDES